MSVKGKCPKCGGELTFPEGMSRIICMYCGNPVKEEELVQISYTPEQIQLMERLTKELNQAETKEKRAGIIEALLQVNSYHQEANQAYVRDHIGELLDSRKALLKLFKEETYEEAFEDYMEKGKPILTALENACYEHEPEKAQILNEMAQLLMSHLDVLLEEECKDKRNRKQLLVDDYKMMQVVYLVPMIRELKLEISEPFSDAIIEAWLERFPKEIYYKGDYHKLIEGFRKRKVCYITTAVCETFGKPDNCYELMCFRQFRDEYLLQQPGGEEAVSEYYQTAPLILGRIDELPEKEEIYRGIWDTYLEPCLLDIRDGHMEECRIRYEKMVHTLRHEYS